MTEHDDLWLLAYGKDTGPLPTVMQTAPTEMAAVFRALRLVSKEVYELRDQVADLLRWQRTV